MQFRRIDGPFCRNCGISAFRMMTSQTLIQGWWGVLSFFITPVTLLVNVFRRRAVARLGAPTPPKAGQYRRPADPGTPIFSRPSVLLASVPGLIFMIFLAHAFLFIAR
jgi:hypothetical protein